MATEMKKQAATPAAASAQPIVRPTLENAPYAEYGRELVNSALYGTLLAGGGAALYHLLSGAQKSDPKTLLHNPIPYLQDQLQAQQKQKKKAPKSRKNLALKAASSPAPAAPGSANGLMQQLLTGLGKAIPPQFLPDISLLPGGAGSESPTIPHRGWRTAANYLAAMGGGAGGLSLVKSIADKKKKEDLADEVDSARKEYFNALTGKAAAVLDAAYEKYAQTPATPAASGGTSWLSSIWNSIPSMQDAAVHAKNVGERGAETLWSAALLSALGSGAIGAKYMYDHTKAHTAAENLRKAREARARLRGLQQTPYVDPGELAAIAGR